MWSVVLAARNKKHGAPIVGADWFRLGDLEGSFEGVEGLRCPFD